MASTWNRGDVQAVIRKALDVGMSLEQVELELEKLPNPDEYNGYPNYETWCVSLWMDNDEGDYRYWQETAKETYADAQGDQYSTREQVARRELTDKLKDLHEERAQEANGDASVLTDLINAALGVVDWRHIAENLLEQVEKCSYCSEPSDGEYCDDCGRLVDEHKDGEHDGDRDDCPLCPHEEVSA